MLAALIGPEHVLTLCVVLIGFCFVLGRRRWANGIALTGLGALALPVVAAALWPFLPLWALLLLAPLAGLMSLQAVLRFVFGEQAASQVIGEWLIRFFDAVFRALTWPVRRWWRRW